MKLYSLCTFITIDVLYVHVSEELTVLSLCKGYDMIAVSYHTRSQELFLYITYIYKCKYLTF